MTQEALNHNVDDEIELPEIDPDISRAEYHRVLEGLSQASVDRHFDAFRDIAWEDDDFKVDPTDKRWILPRVDPLGGCAWYQSQPEDKQIAIGLYRQANVMKVGLQFENILIRGIMQYVFSLPNGSPEFRYLTHEATEECHHTQMFQQGVNRIGADVAGMPWWLRKVSGLIPLAASAVPMSFFIGVLAGEEPIDHTQKAILRSKKELPPVLTRIMEIHVAEEARHISFAHQWVRRHSDNLGRFQRALVSIFYPIIMRVLCDAIMVPPKEFRKKFGVPKKVLKDLYWDAPESQEYLAELFSDVRLLAEESGFMNPVSRRIWKWLKMDGRVARYRSEPPVEFTDAA